MANLPQNTSYASTGTQPSIANLSGIVKAIQQNSQKTASNTVQSAISSHFAQPSTPKPVVAASPFSAVPPAPIDLTKMNNYDSSAAGSIFSAPAPVQPNTAPGGIAPYGVPIAPQTPEGSAPPSYERFLAPTENKGWVLPSGTSDPVKDWGPNDQGTPGEKYITTPPDTKAELHNWPLDMGGGQYVIDPTQPGTMIKSGRVLMNDALNPGARQSVLGGLSGKLYQVDHIIPLMLGGADTLSNLEIYTSSENAEKQRVQAVAMTLLAHGKISLPEARAMAFSWKDKDPNGLPSAEDVTNKYNGLVPLDVAEKQAEKWKAGPSMWSFFPEAFKETAENMGNNIPILGEFAKGLVGGGTAGIVPDMGPSSKSGTLGVISNVAGNILGTVTGIGLLAKGLGWGINGAKTLLGIRNAVAITDGAMAAANLTTDIGNVSKTAALARVETLKKMAASAGLLSVWGQLGLTGREVTGQQQAEFKNHVSQFLTDVAYGSLLGGASQSIRGYARVGLGTTAVSLISQGLQGQEPNIITALQDGAIMSALHSIGYKKGIIDPKTRIGNEEAYKMSVNIFNQYLGEVVPTVKKGQNIPTILKLDISSIEKARTGYQQRYPDTFSFDRPITDQAGAVQFLGDAARRELRDSIIKGNGSVPQEDIKKEMTRITVAQNQMYNQTLDPTTREQKELTDLFSLGEKLRSQGMGAKLRSGIDATKLLNETPFIFPNQTYENPQNLTFLTGNVPTTGYGENIDIKAKNTISDYANHPNNYSGKLFIVKDPETAKVMRMIQSDSLVGTQTEIKNGKKIKVNVKPIDVGNPDDALRVFVKTSDGEISPVGYMPQEASFDLKKNNLNKTYYEITNRLRHTIETSKTPEDLKTALSKDKAQVFLNDTDAQKLFDSRKTLKNMSDESLYAILKPQNAFEKYDSSLNNSTISQEMDKHGLNVLVVDKSKLMPIGGGPPRANPENPYISLNLNEQDWLRSLALKNGEIKPTTPVNKGIKNILDKQAAQRMAKTSGKVLDKVAPATQPTPVTEPTAAPQSVNNLTREEIKSLKKQGFTDEMIRKLNTQSSAPKPLMQTFSPETPQPEVKTPVEQAPTPPKQPQDVVSPPEPVQVPESVKTPVSEVSRTPKQNIVDEFFNDIVARVQDAQPDLSSAQNHEKSLMSIVNGFKRNNPGLPESEFRDALNTAKSRATAYVQDFIDNHYGGQTKFGSTDEFYSRTPVSENKNVLIRRYNEIKAREKETTLRPFEKTELNDLKAKINQHIELDKQANAIKTTANSEDRPLTDSEKSQINDLDRQRFTLTQDYMGGKNSSLALANKFGLELQPPNEAGIRFLKLDKGGNPTFTEEFKKANGIKDQSPESFWGSFLKNEMNVYKSNLSRGSNEWGQGIEEMKKSNNSYAKGFASAIDEALKEKFDVVDPKTGATRHGWQESWKLNSALKNLSSWFDLSNEEGYAASQPFKRTAAVSSGKNYAEIRKKVTLVDAETKKASEMAQDERMDRLSKGNAPELPQGMRVKDKNQVGNVSEDLTPFDMMTNGLLSAEVRNKLVNRYNNLRKEFGSGLAKNNSKTAEDMKEMFDLIKNLSVNIPEETKTWKLGSKIELKNGGNPTVEEGIKDGMRVVSSIFKNKKTPGYVRYENIREKVLKQLGNKKDGQGGPYDGQGGLLGDMWGGIKDMSTAKINYGDIPSTPTVPPVQSQIATSFNPIPPPAAIVKSGAIPQTPAQPSVKPAVVNPAPIKSIPTQPPAVKNLAPVKSLVVKTPVIKQPVSQPSTFTKSQPTMQQSPVVTPKEIPIPKATPQTTVQGVNLAGYATDNKWLANVKKIHSELPDIKTPQDVQAEINRVAPNSPITGDMVFNMANKYQVDPKLGLAILRQESNLGTSTRATLTKNPASILLLDNGKNNAYQSWADGVEAMFRELYRRKITG